MKEAIKVWLQGPRVYLEGVSLYVAHGSNRALKNSFQRSSASANMEMLVYELATLAGITEQEAKNMTRVAAPKTVVVEAQAPVTIKALFVDDLLLQLAASLNVTVHDLFASGATEHATEEQQQAIQAIAPAYEQIPETMKKVIRIRETYPFLKDADCPTELKVLVHDMFNAYDTYREAYAALDDKNTPDENLALAMEVVENYLDNRAMWAELDYYKENNALLGEHPMFEQLNLQKEIAALTDIELIQNHNNAKSNITKSKKKLDKATTDEEKAESVERLKRWENRKEVLESELANRKKQ